MKPFITVGNCSSSALCLAFELGRQTTGGSTVASGLTIPPDELKAFLEEWDKAHRSPEPGLRLRSRSCFASEIAGLKVVRIRERNGMELSAEGVRLLEKARPLLRRGLGVKISLRTEAAEVLLPQVLMQLHRMRGSYRNKRMRLGRRLGKESDILRPWVRFVSTS